MLKKIKNGWKWVEKRVSKWNHEHGKSHLSHIGK